MFSILGPPPTGARVLDLCAGSGALGIEALSRGAAFAHFVDHARGAVHSIRKNLDLLGFSPVTAVWHRDVIAALTALARSGTGAFQWVFFDPPYASGLYPDVMRHLANSPLVSTDGRVIVEHDRRTALDLPTGRLAKQDARIYGDTQVTFLRCE